MSAEHPHLDAETLAAWMDGGLDAPAVAAVETHVSNCEHCQAMVATFVRTEPAAPGTLAPGTLSWWRWWLAPIAATAAAVTIWMVAPRPPSEPLSQVQPPTVTAEKAATDAPPPAATAPAETQARAAEPQPPRQLEQTPGQKTLADNSAPGRAASSELQRDTRARDQAALGATAERRAKVEEAAGQRADAALSKPMEAESRRAELPAAPAAAPAPAAPAAAVALRSEAPAIEAISPDGSRRWRAAGTGLERSDDGGATWRHVHSSTGRLLAASSPSPAVCWFAGANGTLLVTTDGATFRQVPPPAFADLVGVTAVDARTVTVTTADGRTFTTSDTGKSWK